MILQRLIKLLPSRPILAHCDIPCGIYDPHQMQMAAHTILRMVKLINEITASSENAPIEERKEIIHKLARMTQVKEKHGELCEHELVTLWADYFKDEHLKDYPDLHELVWKTIKLTGKVRQELNLEAAQQLLENTQKIAEVFWRTKGMEPIRISSGYPTEGEMVSHK